MSPLRMFACSLVLLLACATQGRAQDSQYWTQKYGTKGLLLSGVAIGGGVDLSTTYYNPGGLALLGDSMKVIAVKAFDFSNVTIDHATDEGEDISEPRNSVLPSFFGGTVGIRLAGSSPLAYSLFPRQLAKFNMSLRNVRTLDVLPQPGAESVVDEARFEEDLDETWGGVTWSRAFGTGVSLGVSQYVAVRSQRARRQILLQALADESNAGSAVDFRGFSYNDIRAVTKVGLALEFSRARAGLVITSPGLHVSGSADVGWDRFRDGFNVDADPELDNQLIASFQDGVPSNFRSPPSIGAGVAVDLGGTTTLHVSAEAFGEKERYSVFEMAPAIDQGTGQEVPFEFFDERKSVVNFGAGIERQLGPQTSAFASFSSDFTSTPHGESDIAFGDWDSYLITAGLTLPVGRSEFTLGLGYGFGSGDADRIGALNDSPLINSAVDTDFEEASTGYRNFRLIVGFTL